MTALLNKAIAALQQLSPEQQNAMASFILEELADQERWDRTFAQSQDVLADLANGVRAEIGKSNTKDKSH